MRYNLVQFLNELLTSEKPLEALNDHAFLTDPDAIFEFDDLLLYVTDTESNYSFNVIIWLGLRWLYELKLVKRMLYAFDPDQRPYTLRLIGKPSSGPSPPRN